VIGDLFIASPEGAGQVLRDADLAALKLTEQLP